MRERFSFSSFFNECRRHKAALAKYMAFFITIGLAIGFLSFVGQAERSAGVISLLQLACFTGLGGIHLFLLHKRLSFWRSRNSLFISSGGWWFTVFLSLEIAGCLWLLFVLTGKGSLRIAWAGSCIFVLPLTVVQSWLAFAAIPEREYQVWYSPLAVPEALTLSRGKGIHVQIRVSRNYSDRQKISFDAAMPVRVRLGNLFYHFIIEQNDNNAAGISYLDEDQQPFGWEFYTSSWGGMIKRRLYPEWNMVENRIKENNIIIVRRVKRDHSNKGPIL